jgi:hypothetical protein
LTARADGIPIRGTPYNGEVWAATDASGETIPDYSCDDWETTGGIGGAVGLSSRTDASWTNAAGPFGCATRFPVYCMEY